VSRRGWLLGSTPSEAELGKARQRERSEKAERLAALEAEATRTGPAEATDWAAHQAEVQRVLREWTERTAQIAAQAQRGFALGSEIANLRRDLRDTCDVRIQALRDRLLELREHLCVHELTLGESQVLQETRDVEPADFSGSVYASVRDKAGGIWRARARQVEADRVAPIIKRVEGAIDALDALALEATPDVGARLAAVVAQVGELNCCAAAPALAPEVAA
jgi:hypothetical protein